VNISHLMLFLFIIGQVNVLGVKEHYVEQVQPSPEWIDWWHEAEECIGQKLDINKVAFYVVNDELFVARGILQVEWSNPFEREIYIVANLIDNESLMQHAFAHQFMDGPGHLEHPFKTCGWSPIVLER